VNAHPGAGGIFNEEGKRIENFRDFE